MMANVLFTFYLLIAVAIFVAAVFEKKRNPRTEGSYLKFALGSLCWPVGLLAVLSLV